MTSVQLKKNIIDKLQSIDDVSFLEAINTIIDAKSVEKYVKIKPDFEEELLKRKKNIENGHLISNDELFESTGKWLIER
jgi:hypothetical protein